MLSLILVILADFWGENNRVFLKTNVIIHLIAKFSSVLCQKRQLFWRNLKKKSLHRSLEPPSIAGDNTSAVHKRKIYVSSITVSVALFGANFLLWKAHQPSTYSTSTEAILSRVTRWYILTKIQFWIHLEGAQERKMFLNFKAIWYILCPFSKFGVIWYIFPRFGILHQNKSGNVDTKYDVHRISFWRVRFDGFNLLISLAIRRKEGKRS
jgi:hypothetical protein